MSLKYLTPVVTALNEDLSIDEKSNENLYSYIINGDIDGIVLMGSTGEFYSLKKDEKIRLIDLASNVCKNKCDLFVGTGSMDINETIELSNYALKKGAKAVMIVGQYYFSFDENTIFSYFDELATKIDGEIYLYNFPDRTNYDINSNIVEKLIQKHKNITGYKDTLNEFAHTRELITKIKPINKNFAIFSGYDENLAHIGLSGGDGVIGALSNLYPNLLAKWRDAINKQDFVASAKYQQIIDIAMGLYSISTPFIPTIKYALKEARIIKSNVCKTPFASLNDTQRNLIKQIIKSLY